MPEFTVPQFIEYKPKIVGPLTLRQFMFIGIAGVICFFLYFTIPFHFFLLAAIIIMLTGAALAFVKIENRALPEILKNFLKFYFAPKIYLWKKKAGPPPKLVTETPETKPEEIKKTPVPTIVGKSRLKNLSTQIETRK